MNHSCELPLLSLPPVFPHSSSLPPLPFFPSQNLLRLSFGSAGLSPDAQLQSHSLPSSVSDALEAMGMEDLNLEELESGGLREEPQEVRALHWVWMHRGGVRGWAECPGELR